MILVDTHVLLWLRFGDSRLGSRSRIMIEQALAVSNAAVSAISFWEVGMRVQKDQLDLGVDLRAWRRDLLDQGLAEIPVDGDVAARAGLMEGIHGDPADRVIVATALDGHQLLTADRRILNWPGSLNRFDARE